ncbi:MAG: dephospho-CoA kinase [bacterium]
MKLIGLTGGIAGGKSMIADSFSALGVPIIDTDILARQVVLPGQPAWFLLKETFPADCFLPDGNLNRNQIAEIVFNDSAMRKKLEEIIHPAVYKAIDEEVKLLLKQTNPPKYAIIVVPLLFETNAEAKFDAVIAVKSTQKDQITRMMHSRGYTRSHALMRIKSQLSVKEKCKRADFVIDNTSTIEKAKNNIINLHKMLIA